MIKFSSNVDDVRKRLQKLGERITNTELANRKVAIELYGWVMRNFDEEGGLQPDGWEALAPGTVRWKEAHGYEKILQNTGALRQSFEPFHDSDVAGVGARDYTGGDAPANLAAVHEYGTRTIPARPMLPEPMQVLQIGINVYGAHIKDAIERGGTP